MSLEDAAEKLETTTKKDRTGPSGTRSRQTWSNQLTTPAC